MAKSESFSARLSSAVKSQVKKQPAHSLITLERTQKLDLLMHLIANLRQSLIVCGPDGIGKTTFLKVLQERPRDDWYYCAIPGTHNLSINTIQEQLKEHLKTEFSSGAVFELGTALLRMEQKNQKVVLIIDNAGLLVPGVIDALNLYAIENPSIRVVFALSQDELYVKTRSDKTIEDCHFIELPPLSEQQCGVFLQYLSSQPVAPIAINTINESMIAYIYAETHGIPGRIKAELPKVPDYKPKTGGTWQSISVVLAVVMAGFLYVLIDNDQPNQEPYTSVETQRTSEFSEVAVPGLKKDPDQVSIRLSKNLPQSLLVEKKQSITGDEAIKQKNSQQIQIEVRQKQEISDAETWVNKEQIKPEAEEYSIPDSNTSLQPGQDLGQLPSDRESEDREIEKSENAISDDLDWLFKQTADNYTLQLVALSNEKSLLAVKGKYSSEQYDFKYAKTKIGNKEKFILLYGSFINYSAAARAMQTLPKEFRKAWVRKFNVLQIEVKKAQ